MSSDASSDAAGRDGWGAVLPSRPHVLVAPDKLKGSATARDVADALARGLLRTAPGAVVRTCPVADGGDGTVAAMVTAGYAPVEVAAVDALGEPTRTTVAVQGTTAVVELADVCGLGRLAGRHDPLATGTYGLGLVLAEVLGRGATDVVLGLGGSASTDGGLGLLLALGARAEDADGRPVPPTGAGLLAVRTLDVSRVRLPPGATVRAVCDVDAPLHGAAGAAVTFGPQKGATPEQVVALDRALVGWAGLLAVATGRRVADVPGAGAAGGVGAALLAALGGDVVPGAAAVLEAVRFDDALAGTDLVVTAEGRWDATSVRGKAPGEVVRRAAASGVPAAVVAGQVAPGAPWPAGLVQRISLAEVAGSTEAALDDPLAVLESVGAELGRSLTGRPADPRMIRRRFSVR